MIDYPNLFFDPAQQAGIRFLRLHPKSKMCAGSSWEGSILPTPGSIRDAFSQGFNVGFLFVGKGGLEPNPLGVWGLDIDSKAAFERYDDAPFDLMISRGHEFKRHLIARLPDPTKPRHSRLVRKSHDVKLTGILVAPGSRHKEGGTYSVFMRDPQTRAWIPWDGSPIDWAGLSVVDPFPYIPSSSKLVPLSPDAVEAVAHLVPKEWLFQETSTPAEWKYRQWVAAKGDLATRQIRADCYIRNRIQYGIVSRSGDGGRATLLTTVIHLVQFLQLPDWMVIEKLMKPVYKAKHAWNDMCTDAETGEPCPWTEKEVMSAVIAAYAYVPYFGILEYERLQNRKQVEDRLDAFWELLGHLPDPRDDSPSMSASDLHRTFLERFSVDPVECSDRLFYLQYQAARRDGRFHFKNIRGSGRKKLRHYQGVSPELIDFALELVSLDGPTAA